MAHFEVVIEDVIRIHLNIVVRLTTGKRVDMIKRFSFPLLVVAALLITSCNTTQIQSRRTNDKFMQLNVGMSREDVLSMLGKPYKREVYGDSEFLIYETNHLVPFEKERFTPILLNSGKVVGWGRNYYDDAIKSKIDADIKFNDQ